MCVLYSTVLIYKLYPLTKAWDIIFVYAIKTKEQWSFMRYNAKMCIWGKLSILCQNMKCNVGYCPHRLLVLNYKVLCSTTSLCLVLFQSNAKLKLVRSLAVCEESSGPFSNDGPPDSVHFCSLCPLSAVTITCMCFKGLTTDWQTK